MPNPPNILFIFTDQQRADTVGVVNPVMRTPVMDRLAAEGTLFTRAYTPVPVCVPARCSLIFGQYPARTGCLENNFAMPPVTEERPTMMSALGGAGYQAHGVGKMHFTPNGSDLMGFESRVTNEEIANPEGDDYVTWLHQQGFDWVHDFKGARGEMYYIPQPSQLPARAHTSHWVADRSIEFLQNRGRTSPFFLMTSFIDPHPPFSPPTPWNKLYRAPGMPLPLRPPDMENLWTYTNRFQNRYKYRDQGIDDNLLRCLKAYYYGTVSFIDYNVGRILQVLDQLGDLENTLILWSSDHGEFLGDYNCFGKRSFLKPAGNVPLIVRYPQRFQAGAQCDTPASLVDIMPTFLAAAGIDSHRWELDGIDLADLAAHAEVRGSQDSRMVFGHYQSGNREDYNRANYMALTSRWKYIYSASENREFLFDLLIDPDETRNRSETLGYMEQTKIMRHALVTYLRQQEFTAPLDGENWKVFPPPAFPRDPDAGLLFQDPQWTLPLLKIPGYND